MRWLPNRSLAVLVALAVASFAWDSAWGFVTFTTSGGTPLRWHDDEIRYALDSNHPAELDGGAVEERTLASFDTWDELECLEPTFTYLGNQENLELGYSQNGSNENAVLWVHDNWTEGNKVVALTKLTYGASSGRIVDADIQLNAALFRFTTTDQPGSIVIDLQNTLTHEIGHVLGLDHTPDAEATMAEEAPRGEVKKRTLEPDDVAGICFLYAGVEPGPDAGSGGDAGGSDTSWAPGGGSCGVGRSTTMPPLPLLLLAVGLVLAARRRSPR